MASQEDEYTTGRTNALIAQSQAKAARLAKLRASRCGGHVEVADPRQDKDKEVSIQHANDTKPKTQEKGTNQRRASPPPTHRVLEAHDMSATTTAVFCT